MDANSDTWRCSFLKLPAELRNRIYELILPKGRRIELNHLRRDKFRDLDQLHFTRVNRQMRAETTPLFYAHNTFRVLDVEGDYGKAWHHWLNASRRFVPTIARLEMNFRLCHFVFLVVEAPAGRQPSCYLIEDEPQQIKVCNVGAVFEDMRDGEIRDLLRGVGRRGFEAEDYIRLAGMVERGLRKTWYGV